MKEWLVKYTLSDGTEGEFQALALNSHDAIEDCMEFVEEEYLHYISTLEVTLESES